MTKTKKVKTSGVLKIKTLQVINLQDWDDIVVETYKRPYYFQQQNGCRSRGLWHFAVPDEADDYTNDTVPEEVNHADMGVNFKAWLARDPKQKIPSEYPNSSNLDFTALWWERNFYPDFQILANDLYEKGILPAGDYAIEIDW